MISDRVLAWLGRTALKHRTRLGSSDEGHASTSATIHTPLAIDLNTLVAPSPLRLVEADSINDRGEIEGLGRLANGTQHEFLLIPSH
jgi:hypothetical protein